MGFRNFGVSSVAAAAVLSFGLSAQALTLDFNGFATGDVLTSTSIGGVSINFIADDTDDRPLVVFDTASPTGDNPGGADDGDLAAPNGDCPGGGPGVGNGGQPGDPGANCRNDLGKALIIHEDKIGDGVTSVAEPDDYARGGSFLIEFSEAVRIDAIGLLDIENDDSYARPTVELVGGGTTTLADIDFLDLGDNSFQEVIVDVPDVTSLRINFGGSAAMPYLNFSLLETGGNEAPPGSVPTPAALPLLFGGLAAALRMRHRRG